ncbi:AzlC family ABC transporter permease [Actinomyces sp. B33]|uniref:AzlC family ABC transporter permease n=1 Tax=Actinomyces sp. B33 TaxID=2942131 RepID=UPI002341BC41|nr:AzlC family ABC transporter permease [Actinomyces sp. B33]MDC4233979.1 AzlC family ABC transporter permease [Actinomyces sp. B33]
MTGLPRTAHRPVPARSVREEIAAGVTTTLPAAAGYVPLGIAYGVLVMQVGMPWWMAPALSFAAYSGSAELLVIVLAAQSSPLSVIAVTMLLVNFRHVFYAFSFPLHVVEGRLSRLYSMYALVDEAFALTAARPEGWTKPRLLAMQVTFQVTWVVSGMVGVAAGAMIPETIEGLDFALCAMFITLALDAARGVESVPSVLMGGASYLVALAIMPGHSLLVALLIFVGMLVVRHLVAGRGGGGRAPGEGERPRGCGPVARAGTGAGG